MPAIGFVVPILPGKLEEHRQLDEELMGSRREEFQESRRRLGIHRESSWHQTAMRSPALTGYQTGCDESKLQTERLHNPAHDIGRALTVVMATVVRAQQHQVPACGIRPNKDVAGNGAP